MSATTPQERPASPSATAEPVEPAVTPKRESSARTIGQTFIVKMIGLPIAFVASVLTARMLGPEQRGLLGFVTLLQGVIVPLLVVGTPAALAYFLASKKYAFRDVAFTALGLALVAGLVTASGALGLRYLHALGKTGNAVPYFVFFWLFLLCPLGAVRLMLDRATVGTGTFRVGYVTELIAQVMTLVLTLVLVVRLRRGLHGVLEGLAVVAILVAVLISFGLVRGAGRPRIRVDRPFFGDATSYGLRVWLGSLVSLANMRLDQVLVAAFTTPAQLAFYGIAVTLCELSLVPANAADGVMFHRLAGQEEEARREFVALSSRLLVFVTTICCVGLAVLVPLAIPLVYGVKYRGVIPVFFAYVASGALYPPVKVLSKYFGATGRPELVSRIQLVSFFAAVPGYALGTALWGGVGAAVASSVATGVALGYSLWLYRKLTGSRILPLLIVRADDLRPWVARARRALRRA